MLLISTTVDDVEQSEKTVGNLPKSCNWMEQYHYTFYSQNKFVPQIPAVSFIADTSLDCLSDASRHCSPHWPCAYDFRSSPGSEMFLTSPWEIDSLLLLIKSVSQVSVLIYVVLGEREIGNILSWRRKIAHLFLRSNVIGCFQTQGCHFLSD